MCSKKVKGIIVKVFNMIANKNEAKTMTKIFHVNVNANLIVQHVIQIKNGIIKHVNVNVKIIISAKKIIVGILAHVFDSKYLKRIADTSVITCDETISVINIVSTKVTNTLAAVSINCPTKKIRNKIDCYILYKVLLVIILLLIITIICYCYTKHRSKQKDIDVLTI